MKRRKIKHRVFHDFDTPTKTTGHAEIEVAGTDIVTRDGKLSDCVLSLGYTTGEAQSSFEASIIFRLSDANNYYRLKLISTGIVLYKKVSGSESLISNVNFSISAETSCQIKILLNGDIIEIFTDGILRLSHVDIFNKTATQHGFITLEAGFGTFNTLSIEPLHYISPGVNHYYVSQSEGNDSTGDGTIGNPWKTLAKINGITWSAGDVIHLKCGDTWREQLIPNTEWANLTGYVTYTSYGDGAKPLILGSIDKSLTEDWTDLGSNIWRASGFLVDVGNIIFNHESVGIKVYTSGALNGQGKFWYDSANNQVRMYSTANPATVYNSIECALTQNIINEVSLSFIRYENLELKYGGTHGIGGYEQYHIIVRNCDISWMGGGYLDPESYEDLRYGNGIEFYGGAEFIRVEGCKIEEIFDTAITNQSTYQCDMLDLYFRWNKIINAEWSYEYWNDPSGSTKRIKFENNDCYGAGYSWGNSQRSDPSGIHLNIQANATDSSDISVKYNIFDRAKDLLVYVASDTSNLSAFDFDYNIYRQPSGEIPAWGLFDYNGTGYNFANYKIASGKDTNSSYEEY